MTLSQDRISRTVLVTRAVGLLTALPVFLLAFYSIEHPDKEQILDVS